MRTGLHVQKQVIAAPVVHFGLGEADARRGRPHHLAERLPAVGVRPRGGFVDRREPAAQGIVPVAVRLERHGDGLRHRLHLALAARPAHQRAGDRRRADDRGLGQDPRRPARAAQRPVRSVDHRGAVGDALLRSRLAARRRSSRRHRNVRGRAVRGAAAAARRDRHRAGAELPAACATIRAATSSTSSAPATIAISTSPAAAPTRA